MDSKDEKWFQSRRVWAALLSLVAVVAITLFPEQYEVIATLATLGAGSLGLSSWTMPKKK